MAADSASALIEVIGHFSADEGVCYIPGATMPAAIDLRPFAKLHALFVLRDLIRKWWKLELFLVDAQGEPVWLGGTPTGGTPRPIAPDNDFCRLAQHAPLGARRCEESLRVTLDKLHAAGRGQRTLVHECHLGFDIAACALWLGGEIAGLCAVSGAMHEPWTPFGETQLLRKVAALSPSAGAGTDLERGLRRVPFLTRGEMEQLDDLLQLCADEIAAHHEAARKRALVPGTPFDEIIGTSPSMQALLRQLEKIGGSEAPVLIRGEAGTGKELLARAIHRHGPRCEQPFHLQHCAPGSGSGKAEAFLETELFDLLATAARDSATLFLDEVAGLPPSLQLRLLQALQEGPPDVRILAATSEDLEERVRAGTFHKDLYEHLSLLQVRVPPLRERVEDIPILGEHFLRLHHQRQRHRPAPPPLPQSPPRLAGDLLALLLHYPWPGNVRELENEMTRLLLLSGGLQDLHGDLLSAGIRGQVRDPTHSSSGPS